MVKYLRRYGDWHDALYSQAINHEGMMLSLIHHPDVIRRIDHGFCLLGEFPADSLLTELTFTDTMYMMIDNVKNHAEPELPLRDKLALFANIVRLIAYLLWNNNILHCDLKTENILVSQDRRRFKLIDFGCAKNGPVISPLVAKHTLKKRHYLAPELHKKDTCHSEQTEVFALGCILFSLLFNVQPFGMATSTDFYYKYLFNEDYEMYWSLVEKQKGPINSSIKNLLSAMFATEPSLRPSLGDVILAISLINP